MILGSTSEKFFSDQYELTTSRIKNFSDIDNQFASRIYEDKTDSSKKDSSRMSDFSDLTSLIEFFSESLDTSEKVFLVCDTYQEKEFLDLTGCQTHVIFTFHFPHVKFWLVKYKLQSYPRSILDLYS